MQLSDFPNIDSKTKTALRRAFEQWSPRLEARVIELLNQGLSQSDVNKILSREGSFDAGAPKAEYRGLKAIYQKLLEDGKLDPSITEISKAKSGKYATAGEIAIQDKQILDHYLENQENFKGKPANQVAKSFSSKYGLATGTNLKKGEAISATTVKRALENAIAGNYPDYDEYFKARPLDEFVVSRHANIFPDVNKLDKLIKKIVSSNDNYLVDESLDLQERMKRLRNEYAKEIGMATTDPKLENNFTARIRKLMNRYGGQNVERYEKALYETIKPPAGYADSLLHKSLMAITSHAGKMSNKDTALQLGLSSKDIRLLENMSTANARIARKYNLPKVVKGGTTVSLAGDHTDIKALMRDFGNYKKDFMRIAYIGDALNTIKASYDKKIIALKNLAEQGIKFDEGTKRSNVKYLTKSGETGVSIGKRTLGPFSGPLTPAEQAAGGRTIPAAVAKLQKEFSDLSGGYKIGGFDIVDGKVVAPKNFIQPRINERTSPISMTIRETLGNLKYGGPESKKITDTLLNVVDRAIVGPEGQTTKGRIDILKRFGPKDLEGSGYLHAMKTVGEKGTKQSQQITAIIEKGMQGAIDAADTNENNICSIFGMKRGGLAGGGCGVEMRKALNEAPDETMKKIAEGPNTPVRNIARQILSKLPKGGRLGAILAGAGAVGLGATALMGDAEADETGITDQSMKYNETTGEFVNTETGDPETQQGILNWIADNPGKSGFAALPIMLGAGQALAKAGLPGGRYLTSWTAAIPAMMIPEKMWQYKQGMEAGEMATDPLNALWALGIRGPKSIAEVKAYYDKLSPDQRISLKGLKTVEGWKNLPKGLRAAMMSPAATGTDLAFQKRLKPALKKLTESVIGSPGAKQVAKKGLGALAKRAAIGLGAAALLPATVAAGLISAPLTLGLGALSFGYAQYKDYRDGKAIVDSMRARGKISEEDANNYMSLILQGSLPFGLGNRLFGDQEMTLRGQTLDPTQQRAVLKGMEGEIDIFQDERRDARVLDRADDFDFFNEGGRVGMKTGGMDRRGFLKWLMGLAGGVAAGTSGLFKTGGKKATEQVLTKGLEAGTKQFGSIEGMPAWFPRLISKIKEQGKLVEMADKDYVNGDIYTITLNGKKVTMEQNPLSGEIMIDWPMDEGGGLKRSITYRPGETGFQKYGADPEHPFASDNLEVEIEKPTFEYVEPDMRSMGPEDTSPDSAEILDIFTDGDDVVQAMENLAGKSAKELEAGVEIQSTKDFKTHNQTEHQFPDATWDESENITPLADYQYKQTKDPTKKAGGGRIGYADQGLVGTPTDEVTQYDRRVYTTPTGEEVSEKSVTIPMGGMWINIPSIHDGREYSEDQLTEMILKGEIEPTSVHEDREEAIIVATQRSDMMKRHKKGFNTGGEVETGAIARRQSLVPPLAGPNPQGIMGLPSDVKQVRVG